jgi:2-polyprenyl-3-methyl-5-hydroxy-6-metoxy-1,4-benzoquinol methylase
MKNVYETPEKNWNPSEHYKNVKVAEEYDRIRFSSIAGKAFDRLEKRSILKAFSDLPKGATIVDAPCGTGRLAEALLEAGYDVLGIDISPEMLDVAARKLERFGDRFKTRVADVRELSGEGLRFDAALCARVLMHFPLHEQIVFLRSVAALSSGIVVFNQSANSPYQRLRRSVKRLLKNQVPANYPITNTELQELISGSGLKLDKKYFVLPAASEAVFFKCVHHT